MPNIFLRQDFSPSCPSGGQWYACGTGSHFVGCCRSEPCENGCPAGNLEPASFDPHYYGTFSDQECPSGSRWYTCTLTNPPFLGCCKSNPCAGGSCPADDLTAGFLSSNPALAASFSPSPALSTSSGTALSSLSSSSSSTTTLQTSQTGTSAPLQFISTHTPTPIPDPIDPYQPHHSTSTGAIVGGAIGGALVIAILLLLLYCRRKQTSKRKANPTQPSFRYNDNNPGTEVGYQGLKQDSPTETSLQTPLPTYEFYTPPTSHYPPQYTPSHEKDGSSAVTPKGRNIFELPSPPPPPSSSPQPYSDEVTPKRTTPNGLGVMVPTIELPSPSPSRSVFLTQSHR